MYDTLIKNGMLVDGTGSARRQADVAIAGGRIVEIGRLGGSARQVIDAADLIVAPGFIDPHTHYDAQICWDPGISCSSWHGVTSVVMGNCGVGIAPCVPAHRERCTRDLVTVEGIPFDVLDKGITWEWESFPQFMSAAGKRGSALNLGFLAPLTPFRHFVMGDESLARAANDEETAKIKGLIKEAVAAGALGFSTSRVWQHVGYNGLPLACRNASLDELGAYARGLKELGKGSIELALCNEQAVISEEECGLLDRLLSESGGRPVLWAALYERDDLPDACQNSLRQTDGLAERGARAQVSARPFFIMLDMGPPQEAGVNAGQFVLSAYPAFKEFFARPQQEQRKLAADSAFRARVREELKTPRYVTGGASAQWHRTTVYEVEGAGLQTLVGKTVTGIAAERGKDALDTFFDLALEADFKIAYSYHLINASEDGLARLLKDPRTIISLSDGGAHTDFLCDVGYCTYMLGTWVRERGVMSLEQAVKRLTSEPAQAYGIRDRGTLAPGLAADVVIFDKDRIGSAPRPETRFDLPGGGKRFVMASEGIRATLVNGEVIFENGGYNGALPGRALRS